MNRDRADPREEFADLYPFTSHFLEVPGGRLHYIDEGEGPPLVMVHGNPTWSFYFRGLVGALRDRHRCVALDHMGCGWSDVPDETLYTYTLRRRVDDFAAWIDALGLARVRLIVHDWGGMIAGAWAAAHPERVEGIVVLNTASFALPNTGRLPVSLRLARLPVLGELLVRGGAAFSRGANRFCVVRGPLPARVRQAYLRPYDSWAARLAVQRFIDDIPVRAGDPAHAIVEETAANLHRLKDKPMLICWGMRDFVFDRRFLAEWQRRFPEAQVHTFADAGHYVLEDAFDEILEKIEPFVSVAGPPGGRDVTRGVEV